MHLIGSEIIVTQIVNGGDGLQPRAAYHELRLTNKSMAQRTHRIELLVCGQPNTTSLGVLRDDLGGADITCHSGPTIE